MSLEHVAATAFLEELLKIASDSEDEGSKTAAAALYNDMSLEDVQDFLKHAGFGAMLGGVAKGVGGLASGAARGLGSMAAGAGRGAVGAVQNAASAVGRGVSNAATSAVQGVQNAAGAVKGTLQRAGSAAAAAPGALGQRMTDMGQAAQAKLTGMGQSMAQAGAAKGQALQGRLAGPGRAAMTDISNFQKANAPAAAPKPGGLNALAKTNGPETAPAYKPPMMSMGQTIADSNPFHGMVGSAVSSVKGLLQKAPQYGAGAAPSAAPVGSLQPAAA